MDIRLLIITLCAFASNANGAYLKTLTSHQNRAENATTRTATTSEDVESIDTSKEDESGAFNFDQLEYARQIYNRIYEHLHSEDKQKQFAFISIARSYELATDWPDAVSQRLTGKETIPSLSDGNTFPKNAQSNLVIAGVQTTEESATTSSPVQELIPKLITMDDYYDKNYFKDVTDLVCPFAILLGSRYDNCPPSTDDEEDPGKCARSFIKEKTQYVEETTCLTTLFLVYVNEARDLDQWEKTQGAYYAAGIRASNDLVDVKELSSKSKKKPLTQTSQEKVKETSQQTVDETSPQKSIEASPQKGIETIPQKGIGTSQELSTGTSQEQGFGTSQQQRIGTVKRSTSADERLGNSTTYGGAF